MKNQRNQMIALVVLVIGWALYWHFFIKVPHALVAAKAAEAKAATKSDSLLQQRFHKVRGEMDALYHYRISPAAFDAKGSPFRIPKGMDGAAETSQAAAEANGRAGASDQIPIGPQAPDFAEKLLKSAIAAMRVGGVVTMGGTTQLTVNGELHKEGDEFTTRVPNSKGQLSPVLIKIKTLTTSSVTLSLESDGGGAEMKLRLN
jgi:hypothetical protein